MTEGEMYREEKIVVNLICDKSQKHSNPSQEKHSPSSYPNLTTHGFQSQDMI